LQIVEWVMRSLRVRFLDDIVIFSVGPVTTLKSERVIGETLSHADIAGLYAAKPWKGAQPKQPAPFTPSGVD
jgi:hypothetical protein